jgi:hypothetical protein
MSEKTGTALVIVGGLTLLAYLYLTRTVQMQGIVTEGPATGSGGLLGSLNADNWPTTDGSSTTPGSITGTGSTWLDNLFMWGLAL